MPGESDLGTQHISEVGSRHPCFIKLPGDSDAQLGLGTTVGPCAGKHTKNTEPTHRASEHYDDSKTLGFGLQQCLKHHDLD